MRWLIIAGSILCAAGRTVAARPAAPGQDGLEGRCYAYLRRNWQMPTPATYDTIVIRFTGARATAPGWRGWKIVEPGIGLDYTYYRPVGSDSVRVAWSHSVWDQTATRLAVTDSVLVGLEKGYSDVISSGDDAPEPIRFPRHRCP